MTIDAYKIERMLTVLGEVIFFILSHYYKKDAAITSFLNTKKGEFNRHKVND